MTPDVRALTSGRAAPLHQPTPRFLTSMARLSLLLSLPILLLAAWVPAAGAAPRQELAVQDDSVLLHRHYGDADLALKRAANMGAKRIRVNLQWAWQMSEEHRKARKEPQDLRYDFSTLERLYTDATAYGLKLQVTLTEPAPRWATGNKSVGKNKPNPAAFGRYASAVATQFAGRIDLYSTWNESNWHARLRPPKQAPNIYRNLHNRAYKAIKRADPRAKVLVGELAPGASNRFMTPALAFLRRMTCVNARYRPNRKCPRILADGFAIHPYNFAKKPSQARSRNPDVVEIGSLSRLTSALDRLRARNRLRTPGKNRKMPVYITEFGYFTKGPLKVSPQRQANWTREAWNIARRNPRVVQFLQYLLIDPWPKKVTWRTAVLNRNGKPRPAYHTLRKLARR
jgi:hypothetical protein